MAFSRAGSHHSKVQIKSAKEHRIATLWVAACIGIHNFALRHEAKEKAEEGAEYSPAEDPFVLEGASNFLILMLQ